MKALTLSADQQAAYDACMQFIQDPNDGSFILKGYAGTGKTTLVKTILQDIPSTLKTLQLLMPQEKISWEVQLTATTNKAAEALEEITGDEVATLHSFLGLSVKKDPTTGKTQLIPYNPAFEGSIKNTILFVDEISFMDQELIQYLYLATDNCKIILIGDPAQLAPIKSANSPIFNQGFPQAELTEVVRQAKGNPITELATNFRNTVMGAPWSKLNVDQHHIQTLDRTAFEQEIVKEFSAPDWSHGDSKVLAYTNRTVVAYNNGIRQQQLGNPEFSVGDYAICNHYISKKNYSIKTDQLVRITHMKEDTFQGVPGWEVGVDHRLTAFMPKNFADKAVAIKAAKAAGRTDTIRTIEETWIDLRAAYACTINKSQGSTYKKVFIDLDDLKACRNPNTLARLMYVAVSRASQQLILTGDIV